MLVFAPALFDRDFAILDPENAFRQLARAFCSGYPPEAHRHPHPDHARVIAQTNRANDAIKSALDDEELVAYAVLQDDKEFFRVPREYWHSTLSYLSGKIFAFPAEELVPPQFQDARVVIRRDDWQTWLAKTGIQLPSDQGVPLGVAVGRLVQPSDDFDPTASAETKPWWSVLQTIGWITTASMAYVAHLGALEAARNDEMAHTIAFSALAIYISRSFCHCGAHKLPSELRWEHCSCTGDAGRSLLDAIRLGKVAAIDQNPSPAKRMEFYELAGVGQRSTCADWTALTPNPIFSSAEVIAAFPPKAETERETGGNVPPNRKLDHDEIIRKAAQLRVVHKGISKGSTAASIIAELEANPRTGKPWDNRHIERIISHLWDGGLR